MTDSATFRLFGPLRLAPAMADIDAERIEAFAQGIAVDPHRAGGAELVLAMARQHRLDQRAA